MIADYENGGLKMPDIKAILDAQRIMWVRRYFNSEHKPWKIFFEWQTEKLGGLNIFKNSSLDIDEITKIELMSFYQSIITAWAYYYNKPLAQDNFKKQALYFNQKHYHTFWKSVVPSKFDKKRDSLYVWHSV